MVIDKYNVVKVHAWSDLVDAWPDAVRQHVVLYAFVSSHDGYFDGLKAPLHIVEQGHGGLSA